MDSSKQNFRIDKISIRDYKGIDSLDLEFPRPKFEDDPDIFVIGSRNGLGKTSVLECCAWGLVSVYVHSTSGISGYLMNPVFPSNVRHSAKTRISKVSLCVSSSKTKLNCTDEISFNDELVVIDSSKRISEVENFWKPMGDVDQLYSLRGTVFPTPFVQNTESHRPFVSIDHFFLFFPDKRLIPPGTIAFNELTKSSDFDYPSPEPFKYHVLQAILGKSGLLEGQDPKASEECFDFLNNLVEEFAHCEIHHQLKRDKDSSLDIRVRVKNDTSKDTYSFDGLSSGQKEIISTLFLIWENTRHASKVVFIDEPEQHLNAEWHRLFVHTLHKIAPWNQYILATHSEHIMDAVEEDRRILLIKEDKK
jgi:ABC-type transport system involved in cytochrome c biogenesis ATPase subunit